PEDQGPAADQARGRALRALARASERALPETPDGRRAEARRAPATGERRRSDRGTPRTRPGRRLPPRPRPACRAQAMLPRTTRRPGSTTTPLRWRDVARSRE